MKGWYIVPVWLVGALGVLPAALLRGSVAAPLLAQLQSLLGYCMGAGLVAAGAGWIHLSRAADPRRALATAFAGGLLTAALLIAVR